MQSAQEGGFHLTGGNVDADLTGVEGVDQIPQAGPHAVISSTGALVVDSIKPSGVTEVEPAGDPTSSAVVGVNTQPEIVATAVVTDESITFSLDEANLGEVRQSSRAAGLVEVQAGPGSGALSRGVVGDPHNPVEDERSCSIPRNDPVNQAYQPKPRQVEWAVDRAVKGELTETRPANWRNLGMASYSPQAMFPPVPLVGGGTIPPQIVLGVLMQESNLWQASRYTAPGNTGNPLIGSYYGNRNAASIWEIDYGQADCGYGIGQITDGMRLPGYERTDDSGRPIETALPYAQQRAIALDYTANIAKAVRMLGQKWNELANAGMLINDGRSAYIENWFFTTWAYNSGFHPPTEDGTPWGVGWFNNPINTIYPVSRTPFLEGTQNDASNPQYWPYPEKIIGWAAYGTSLVETQYADPTSRSYVSQRVSSFRTAWWNGNDLRSLATPPAHIFCDPAVNDCDPGVPEPCQLSTSTDHYYECWWNAPVVWRDGVDCDYMCGHGFERFPSSYDTEASSMAYSLPALTLRSSFLANCSPPPTGVVVVDDTTQRNARTSGECAHRTTAGSFEFSFAQADANGRYPAKVDLHQQGGGFNGHFWFAHMRDKTEPNTHVTGTWTRGADMTGTWTRVWVHLPDYAGWTQQAGYTVNLGDGTTQTRYLPQRRYSNEWVSLGVFQMKGEPSVSLSNSLVDDDTTKRYEESGVFDIDGVDNIAWDAVGFQALPGKPDEFVVALGDSFGSGEGAGEYEPWSDNNGSVIVSKNACHQSANAWIRKTTLPGDDATIGSRSDRADVGMDFHFLACSGAVSENLLPHHSIEGNNPSSDEEQSGAYGQAGMVSQLDAGYLDENTTLVTMSIGGNDMRFSDIVSSCVKAYLTVLAVDCSTAVLSGDTEPSIDAGHHRLEHEFPDRLTTVLQFVRERAPNARIAVTGYPKLFESGTNCILIDTSNQGWLNDFADAMNETIRQTVEAANRADEPEVLFVDTQESFTGHNLCTGDGVSGINGLEFKVTPGEDPLLSFFGFLVSGQFVSRTSVHPNGIGTDLYSQALENALAHH
ncbi:GDSL-type esterase/lipase family protein [Xylanimonas ulmi]|uniref:GDSL-like lipase/acylhydrolase family protein n=1 Tax=Xylanimonas ulmi TaxID=228973 RepID=A0A4Q7M6H4_9MICO|nr:GDSL-type esterase/lipase family protein [Xylanibacterium ulmi]RZS62208.1 GDSL-like lipase/acylhydrolase family protein [Xylanibacterium ulmi]